LEKRLGEKISAEDVKNATAAPTTG